MRWALWMLMVGRSCFQLEKSGHGAWQFCKMKVILTIYNDTYTNKKLWIHVYILIIQLVYYVHMYYQLVLLNKLSV